jgi:hypothetical protein
VTETQPEMSVIVVTPSDCAAVGTLLAHLRAQTARARLELVIVAPQTPPDLDAARLEDFARLRIVAVGPIHIVSRTRAVGVRHASAPIVAFTEEHSFPAPDWAEALIQAHRGPWAAVGPVVGNANPDSIMSWATLALQYSRWLPPTPAGAMDDIAGHNSAYKRDILLAYGADLEQWLDFEYSLHQDLRARGLQLYLEPAARTNHLNVTRLPSWLREQFHSGRVFAGVRARDWPLFRRLLYSLGSPLIPVVRLRRILDAVRQRAELSHLAPRIVPWLVFGLIVQTAGEVVGYVRGIGGSPEHLADIELYRRRHVRPGERILGSQ